MNDINNNNEFNNSLDLLDFKSYREYINLIKIYYDKYNVCPLNNKYKIKKYIKGDKMYMSCDNNNFNYEIILPKYKNIYHELVKLRKERNKCLLYFKNSIIYDENVEEFNNYKKKYINIINSIEKYNNILTNDSKYLIKLDKNLFNVKEKLNNLYDIRKQNFDKLKFIDKNTKREIIILFKKKYPLNDTDIENNRKRLNISFDNLKNWLEWISSINKYINVTKEYNKLYIDYKKLLIKMKEKNNAWMDIDPIIINKNKKLKMSKKYKNIKNENENNIKDKTSGTK